MLVLLQHGANPFAAFYPDDAVPTHDDSVRALQVALTDAKDKLLAAEAKPKGGKKAKHVVALRPPQNLNNKVCCTVCGGA